MITKLFILIAFSLLLLVPTGFSFADDKEDKKEKKIKTLESECGKKLDKKNLNLDGLMCQAVFELQSQADAFTAGITINWLDIVGIPADIADGDDDTDTTYSGVDFATSNQNCALGSVVSGIGADGNLICNPSDSGLSCENQRILVSSIPEFNVDLSCFEPLSVSINVEKANDFTDTIQLRCDGYYVTPSYTGGVPPVEGHWEIVSRDGSGTINILSSTRINYELYWDAADGFSGEPEEHPFTLEYVVTDNLGSVSETVDFTCTLVG